MFLVLVYIVIFYIFTVVSGINLWHIGFSLVIYSYFYIVHFSYTFYPHTPLSNAVYLSITTEGHFYKMRLTSRFPIEFTAITVGGVLWCL